jgi:hypothetical protein
MRSELKSNLFSENIFLFVENSIHLCHNQLKQKQMKKSIAAVKANPEFVLVLGVIAFLIAAVTYNIMVHGITSTASFEF